MAFLRRRSAFDQLLAVGGVIIILVQATYIVVDPTAKTVSAAQLEFSVVLLGLLLNQLGVWRLSSKMMPERRVHLSLRREVNHFIDQVKQLNTQALNDDDDSAEATTQLLHESVERIRSYAGRKG